MKRVLLIIILQNFATANVHSQSFTVSDLVTLSSLPAKNIERFMSKNDYALYCSQTDSVSTQASFILKSKTAATYTGPKRSIDVYQKDDSKYFTLHTSSLNEYQLGEQSLVRSGFLYDGKKDVSKESSMLFQKENVTIYATSVIQDGIADYTFILKVKKIPSAVMYAEDLLQFDSHEFLVSFFGEQNVKKDMYYFSEKELKRCSVLYNGTKRQAVFIWGDENNLTNLSYILVSSVIPTEGAEKDKTLTENNEWELQSGIHAGMSIRELLKINEMDFDIYGNKSALAFMAKPDEDGRIDFKKTAISLSCDNCNDNTIFDQKEVSALEVAKANLPLRVNDVIIYPSHP